MKRPRTQNSYRIINGKVVGTFDPQYRAHIERCAAAAGLTFDEFKIRELREAFRDLLSL